MWINRKLYINIFFIVLILGAMVPGFSFAEVLNSANYNIENPSLDSGGENSSSTNYNSRDSIGSLDESKSNSTNYNVFPGFEQHAYPGVPAQPSLSNTGGSLYNALDFVVATGSGQQTDTNYAVAISSDDFATTYFIQIDDTLGASPAWQTYSSWGGGSGQRVTGLASSTTYKIKVKARYGTDTETAYSLTASASTSSPSLTVSFSGINSGVSVSGETTTLTTSANSISYGSLGVNSPAIAAHKVTVTTNATGGYTTTLEQDDNLRTNSGKSISPVSGTNSSPSSWPAGITTGRFGYHSTDSILCTGTTSRFSSNNTWAALDTTAYEVACNASSVTAEETTVLYKLEIGSLQENGSYQNSLTYITTATY